MSLDRIATESPAQAGGWRVVAMLWLICFLNYGDRQAVTAIFPLIHREFGFTSVQLGLIGSAFMWVYAAGAPIAGFIADRVSRKRLILGGCAFWSVVTLLTGRCAAAWQFVAIRASEGLGETFYFPSSMSLLSDYHGPRTRSRAMAIHQSGVYIGTIAGSWWIAWLAARFGWRVGFYCFGAAGVFLAALLAFLLREPVRGQTDRAPISAPPAAGESVRALFGAGSVLTMAAFFAANFVAGIYLVWMPTFLGEKFHYGPARSALLGTLFIQSGSAISAPIGGVLADLLARRLAGGRMLVQAGGLLIGAVFVVATGRADRPAAFLTAMTAVGLCKGIYDSNIFASLYDTVAVGARATAAGVMNTVGWSGAAVGAIAVGWIAQHGSGSSEIANMSGALIRAAALYVVGGTLLLIAAAILGRSGSRAPVQVR